MSKIATVRRLDDTQPQLQIVESVRQLQETTTEMQLSLQALPSAIAGTVSETIAPLQQTADQIARQLDTVLETQRRAIESLMSEIATSASQQMREQTQALERPLVQMRGQTQTLAQRVQQMEATLLRIEALPDRLSGAAAELRQAAAELRQAAQLARPRRWPMVAVAVGAGVLAAALAGIGHSAFDRLVPSSDVQQAADWASAIWTKATPKERELLRQIVNRPAN